MASERRGGFLEFGAGLALLEEQMPIAAAVALDAYERAVEAWTGRGLGLIAGGFAPARSVPLLQSSPIAANADLAPVERAA